MLTSLSYCAFDRQMLDCTYRWLNDADVLALVDAQPVERNAQLVWFNTLEKRCDYIIYGIRYNTTPVGVFGLKNVTDESAEFWGYIGEKQYWGKGIGKWMIKNALDICHEIDIKKLYLKVLINNIRAIGLYKKYNFIEIRRDNKFIYMSKSISNI